MSHDKERDVVGSAGGTVTDTAITCRVSGLLETGEYPFTVDIGGVVSTISVDKFVVPVPPTITKIEGCSKDTATSTTDCPTLGKTVLTITGQGFQHGLEIFVGNTNCLYVSVLSNTQATCQLQPGTGPRNPVVLRLCLTGGASRCLQVSDPEVLSANNYPHVHFAGPNITGLVHMHCSQNSGGGLFACPREAIGNNTLTITGSNFGNTDADVTIGQRACSNVLHTVGSTSTELTCTLPSGFERSSLVYVVQAGGSRSNAKPLGYLQCVAGEFQNGTALECAPCGQGTVTMTDGLGQCSPCLPLIATPSQNSCTACPKNALGTQDGKCVCESFFIRVSFTQPARALELDPLVSVSDEKNREFGFFCVGSFP